MKPGPDRDLRIFLWLVIFVIALVTVLLLGIDRAAATTGYAQVDRVASIFAMRPVKALCYEKEEADSPWGYGAWGYVLKPLARSREMHLDSRMCVGALDVNDESLPSWQRALGVSVVTHEAYHLRRWSAAGNEAKVECKAIRHWKVAARLLGASEETIDDIWGEALAAHYRLADYVDWFTATRPYYDPTCEVPAFLDEEDL